MAGATVTIEGMSNVSAVAAADLEKARSTVTQFGADTNKAMGRTAQGSDSALKAVNGLYNGMQALAGSAIITGAIRIGDELLTIGGKSQVARQSLDAMTSGGTVDWLNQMSAAADGTISRMDMMGSANRALRLGVVDSAEEMAQLTNAARILGKTMGEDTGQAMDDLTIGIGRGSRMILDNLGIIMKQEEIQGEVNKVLAQNPGITAAAAQKQALFNIAIAQANQLQAQGVGGMNTMADEQERLNAAVEDGKEDVGGWLAHGLLPWVENTRALSDAYAKQREDLVRISDTYDEFYLNMEAAGRHVEITKEEFDSLKQAARDAIVPMGGISTAAIEGGRAERDAAAAAALHTSSLEDVAKAGEAVSAALEIYNEILQKQSALQLATQQQVKDLTGLWWGSGTATKAAAGEIADLSDALSKAQGKMDDLNVWGGSEKSFYKTEEEIDILTEKLADAQEQVSFGPGADMAGIFEFTAAQMQQMGLSADQLLAKTNELGLATGQVTELQIAQGTALRELDNLYASGAISVESYISGLSQIPAAQDAVTASSIATKVAVQEATQAMVDQGASAASIIQTAIDTSLSAKNAAQGGIEEAGEAAKAALENFQGVLDSAPAELKMNLNTEAAAQSLSLMISNIDNAQGTLPVDSDTSAAIAIANAAVAKINTMVATITVTATDATGGSSQKAFGGPAPVGGGLTLVGEHGPELVYLPPNAFVATAPATSGLLSGMGGPAGGLAPGGPGSMGGAPVTVNLFAYGVNDPIALTDMVEREIRARGQAFAEVR